MQKISSMKQQNKNRIIESIIHCINNRIKNNYGYFVCVNSQFKAENSPFDILKLFNIIIEANEMLLNEDQYKDNI